MYLYTELRFDDGRVVLVDRFQVTENAGVMRDLSDMPVVDDKYRFALKRITVEFDTIDLLQHESEP